MRELFITRRTGESRVAVVCGRVVTSDNTRLVIKNDVKNPFTGERTERSLACLFEPDVLPKMHIKQGASVMALVDSTDDIDVVFDGGWCEDMQCYETKGRQIRYTGEFIFGATDGGDDDALVLCGTVSDEETKETEPGVYATDITVVYKNRGIDVKKHLTRKTKRPPESLKGMRAVFLLSLTDNGFTYVRKVRTL